MALVHEQVVELTQVNCGECGGTYAINSRYHQQKRTHGGFWNCPYCQCGWGFNKDDTELEKKNKELRQKEKQLEWARREAEIANERAITTKRQLAAQKGVTTKLKKRISHGVCPCCDRTFKNLQSHIEHQHPEYVEEFKHERKLP